MIPRIAHRVWLDEPIPEKFEVFWRRLAQLHPDWTLLTWNDSAALDFLRCRAEFDGAATWAGKSDVLRYELLWRFGGVYLDTDVEPLRAFDELLDGGPFVGWEDQNLLCPTVIGAPPGHAAVDDLLERLPAWVADRPDAPPNQATGPYFLTDRWRERTDVRRLKPIAFYPVGWWEKDRLGGPYPKASFAVHHWAAGWLPEGPPQRRRP
jgi:inositol phosphorylceramide mannosyltransferase catalytic subunit